MLPDIALLRRSSIGVAALVASVTAVWVLWGWGTPGDSFANGNSLVLPSLAAAGVVGFLVGWRVRGVGQVVVALLFVAAVLFWLVVPDGWWVTPPPSRHGVAMGR